MLLTQPTLANAIGPIVFVVVVIGGLGSLGGALIASMLIGILQTFAVAIDYSLLDALRAAGVAVTRASPLHDLYSIKVATAAPIVPYVLLVLILIVRPRGLMGKRDA
jgi:branched-chain amino acid transport system permease protein